MRDPRALHRGADLPEGGVQLVREGAVGGRRLAVRNGPSMTLRVVGLAGWIDIVVVSNATQSKELEQFASIGIEPRAMKTLVADSGALCSPKKYSDDFKKVRRPLWPFEEK